VVGDAKWGARSAGAAQAHSAIRHSNIDRNYRGDDVPGEFVEDG